MHKNANITPSDLSWIIPPECGGQTVEVSYATGVPYGVDAYFLYRRTHDRSRTGSGAIQYEMLDLDHVEGRIEPWNAEPTVDSDAEWQPCHPPEAT